MRRFAIEEKKTPASTTIVADNTFVMFDNSNTAKIVATVRQVLDDPILGPRFRAFAAMRFADEGLRYLDDYHHAVSTNLTNVRQKRRMSKLLVRKYFVDSAPVWVNLSANTRAMLLKRLEENKFKSVSALLQLATIEVYTDVKQSDLFREFCLTDRDAQCRINSLGAQLLDQWLTPEKLASALLVVHNDRERRCVLLCASVFAFEQLVDSKQRKATGFKIWSRFLQPGAAYYVSNLPQAYLDAIDGGAYSALSEVRIECLQRLTTNKDLVAAASTN